MNKTAIALGLCGILGAAAPVAAQQDVALVYKLMLEGQAIVTPARAAQGHVAALGETLNGGDLVNTGKNTRAAIRFTDDGSIIRLNPSSRLQVQVSGDKSAITKTIELEFGELWAKVHKQQGGQFRVQTPAGVAAVKGTEFIVRVDENGLTTILTLEGVVEFFNRGGTTELTKGRGASVANQDTKATAQPIKDADLKQYQGLIEEKGATPGDEEGVDIEVQMQGPDGQMRTVVLRVPKKALKSLLEGGK